jgi:L-aspartate oxidase
MSESRSADFIIVGSGIAGLRAALAVGAEAHTLVLTREAVSDSATQFAQGGIAVAMGEDDTVALHEQDTLAAGAGLSSPAAVKVLVEEGPAAIGELLDWGAEFDRSGARLERTREAAHSRSRILHAHGDSTGREIAATLARVAAGLPRLQWMPHGRAMRLLSERGRITGLECTTPAGARMQLRAEAVLLATGGLGQLYSETTNPGIATGDGPALAYGSGAVLEDMEFVQFHPTALALANAPRFLLSEALRGEGAVLRNPAGERFMPRYHAAAELAPRDVVARALEQEMWAAGGDTARGPQACYLDATGVEAAHLHRRFPSITAMLQQYGLDLATDWIPIRPAAHYAMGGIATDLAGCTTLPGLYAAGECACTGVHGANRLASNSLLEGLVFGARAGRAMAAGVVAARHEEAAAGEARPELAAHDTAVLSQVRAVLSACAGVIRRGDALQRGLRALEPLAAEGSLAAVTAAAIVRAAGAREESRGAHYRSDFPHLRPDWAGRHSWQRRGEPVRFAELL